MYTVTNDKGDKFNVIVVLTGDSYGLEDCLTHEGEPLIEFYDAEYANVKSWDYRGQFIGRYYLKTLQEPRLAGLNLYGGEPKWNLTKGNVLDSVDWAEKEVVRELRVRNG